MAAERLAIVADESGNASEPLRVLAGLYGPARQLLKLERELRGVLKSEGLSELKWAGVRKRPERLRAARAFLALAAGAMAEGRLWADVLVIDDSSSRSWAGLNGHERWLALYRRLIHRARARARGRWILVPDQRTGMPWTGLRRLGLKSVREGRSGELALIQLADLLAGLHRHARLEGPRLEAGAGAWARRAELARDFELHLRALGLLPTRRGGPWQVLLLKNLKRKDRHGKVSDA